MTDGEHLDGLLPALRQLDRDAFTDLYDRMAGHLLAFARSHLRDVHAAEDVVQEVFLRFARHARRFRGDGNALLAWLYTSTRRACIDQHRRRHHRLETLVDTVPEAAATSPGDLSPDGRSLDPELEEALAEITESQRTALVLRRVIGLSGEEVGAVMGLDRDAVYALCARAEAALRQRLASDGEVGGRLSGRKRRDRSHG